MPTSMRKVLETIQDRDLLTTKDPRPVDCSLPANLSHEALAYKNVKDYVSQKMRYHAALKYPSPPPGPITVTNRVTGNTSM